MPLYGGYSRKTIGKNIKLLHVREGRPLPVAVAIAMRSAKSYAKRAGVRPSWLVRKAKRRRRIGHRKSR
jgi:hypothetical protein